ncbi:polyphosphate polymerase domain-containing protein [candidate division KSB1 bacterium]|nr:polyphosphate polymerase domain-containing protein [candidate division KSB1 bacterium]
MTRHTKSIRLEYKYLVPLERLESLRRAVLPFVGPDPYIACRPEGHYRVRSLYCDSPALDCYHTKVEGLKNRKKFRIRGYDRKEQDSIVFLEIKRKKNSAISKNRAPLYYRNLSDLLRTSRIEDYILDGSEANLTAVQAQKFLFHYHRKNLRPVVLIAYEREAYFGKFDPTLRLTFDKNVRSILYADFDRLYQDSGFTETLPGHLIFELKFNGRVPSWMKTLIRNFGLNRRSLSKYVLALDSHPDFTAGSAVRYFKTPNRDFEHAE